MNIKNLCMNICCELGINYKKLESVAISKIKFRCIGDKNYIHIPGQFSQGKSLNMVKIVEKIRKNIICNDPKGGTQLLFDRLNPFKTN